MTWKEICILEQRIEFIKAEADPNDQARVLNSESSFKEYAKNMMYQRRRGTNGKPASYKTDVQA